MKVIVVCNQKALLSRIYAALGDTAASPVMLHATGCESATDALARSNDISLVLVDADLARGEDAEAFHRLRVLQPALPFLMVSELTDRKSICEAVDEVRSRDTLSSPVAQTLLKSILSSLTATHTPAVPDAPVGDPLADEPEPAAQRGFFAHGLSSQTCESLTCRQREVLALLCDGKSNKEIGNLLAMSEGTVKVHCRAIFRELGVRTRMAAAAKVAYSAA